MSNRKGSQQKLGNIIEIDLVSSDDDEILETVSANIPIAGSSKNLVKAPTALADKVSSARQQSSSGDNAKANLQSPDIPDNGAPSGYYLNSNAATAVASPETTVLVKRSLPVLPLLAVPVSSPPQKTSKIVPLLSTSVVRNIQKNSAVRFTFKSVHVPATNAAFGSTAANTTTKLVRDSGSGVVTQHQVSATTSVRHPLVAHSPEPVSPFSAHILKHISPAEFNDDFLKSGIFKAKILYPHEAFFKLILDYVIKSQPHANSKIRLVNIMEINRPSESDTSQIGNSQDINTPKFSMMLWHGTKSQKIAGILKNGFRCPSFGAQMFGQGIYFADRISKSAKYCGETTNVGEPKKGDVGYLFLCQVQIGKCYNAKLSNTTYKTVPTATARDGSLITFDSVMCTGKNIPDRNFQKEINGVVWPVGPTVPNTKFQEYTALYNEYVVYDPKKVQIKYLVKVVFD